MCSSGVIDVSLWAGKMQVCMYSMHALDESAAGGKRFFGSIGDMDAS